MRESFPKLLGIFSHNIWDYGTVYGNKQKEYIVLFIQCRLPAHYTMRNTLKHYENKVYLELKYG